MRAMVLAAGLGTRMRPLSLLRAKPVLPVFNRPLLHWTFDLLARHGFDDVVVNTHHLPGTVRAALGDGRTFGVRVRYSHEPRILGTAGGLRKVRRWLGDAPLLVVNGDMLFDFDLGALYRRHVRSGARATLALRRNPDPKKYGAVRTGAQGRVLSLAGLPRPARGTPWLFTGIHVMDPALLDRLAAGPSDSVRDLYAPLVAEGELLQGARVRGHWYDLGSPALYLASHRALLARGFGGARRGSLVHPTARVARTARVVRSVIGAGSVVEAGAEVRDSVVWDRVRIGRGAAVKGSILAEGVRVAEDGRMNGLVAARRNRRQEQVRIAQTGART